MDEQRYWRSIIAQQIQDEHDRVKRYYVQRSANAGGMSEEEITRLNIFLLCQSIASTYQESLEKNGNKETSLNIQNEFGEL